MTRDEFLTSSRRDMLDRLLVDAIERAERAGDEKAAAGLRLDRLANALEGFRLEGRRGNTITADGRRTLPGKANGPARSRQEAPVRSINHKRIGDPSMRHPTHVCVSVPADTPTGGGRRV